MKSVLEDSGNDDYRFISFNPDELIYVSLDEDYNSAPIFDLAIEEEDIVTNISSLSNLFIDAKSMKH